MNAFKESLRELDTACLELALQSFFHSDDPDSMEITLAILDVLVERSPVKHDAKAAWKKFVEHYMPEDIREQFYSDVTFDGE